jgi:hypothetical protein
MKESEVDILDHFTLEIQPLRDSGARIATDSFGKVPSMERAAVVQDRARLAGPIHDAWKVARSPTARPSCLAFILSSRAMTAGGLIGDQVRFSR